MRLKTFTAPSMTEAMNLIRNELGDLAVILSEQTIAETGEVWVTAAINPEDEFQHDLQSLAESNNQTLGGNAVPMGLGDFFFPPGDPLHPDFDDLEGDFDDDENTEF